MDWRELHGKEAAHWKGKYEKCIKMARCIFDNFESINYIKCALRVDDEPFAGQVWNELDYEVQKLLITAPRYGGPFTTEERKKIKELWEIHTDDIEGL